MADSENSRILPSTTRRNLLSATTVSLVTVAVGSFGEASAVSAGLEKDAAIMALWHEWQDAHQRRNDLCVHQQTLETELLQTIGSFPIVELQVPGKEEPVFARTVKEIDRALPGADMEQARKYAKDKLRSIRKAWNVEDRRIGYSRAYKAEGEAAQAEWTLANTLWKTPAHSIEGVAAKLHSLIGLEDPAARMDENPWPILRSILADLMRMRA